MESISTREPRVLWSFWVACGLAATGAIASIVLAPSDLSRALGVAIPFALAAVLLGIMALTYPRGKSWATALYILAWIAVVYGILRMIAVPLQQAVIGACPVSADVCAPGLSRPFGTGETVAIAVGIITGALALQVGLFGLRAIYRSARKYGPASYATTPPTRVIPTRTERSQSPAETETVATQPGSAPEPAASPAPAPSKIRKPRAKRKAAIAVEPAPEAEQAELPAHQEPAELPAHQDAPELPPHSSRTSEDP
ncbi:MAG TPA: hypothetical protein VGJ79_01960 [Candidatus Dormibacteraeota bacterium]